MEIKLPYGRTHLTANLPDHFGVDIIEAPETPPAANPLGVVRTALENLLGEMKWPDFAAARSVAIAVNDKTRPVPHHQLLPPLLDCLAQLGIPASAIIFYIAVGTHTPMEPGEFSDILPTEIMSRYKVVTHDSENEQLHIYLGETSRGTPVWSNQAYVQSDFKIVVGNIEPHQFAGFSGGVKSAAIGLSSLETINRNHSLMTHPDSQLGEYEINPARQDIEEIGQKMGVHLALNAVLNQDKYIVYALAGDPHRVVQAGVELSRRVCQVAVRQKYALVISSPGGHPKDINVYQAQKGLAHAARITQPGGTVILVAACPEGAGSPHYEAWVQDKHSYAEVLQSFRAEGFRIGPHKAYQIARDASQLRLLFCSDMDESLARTLLLNPVRDLQTALDIALADLSPGKRIGILPHASSTIPYLLT
ncbi:MAG TPA: nickel-dependent lactate racemase [Anaerolineales bacterium]|nr:nickel-dependent lactate racemase [Anaerolineales bacterium]